MFNTDFWFYNKPDDAAKQAYGPTGIPEEPPVIDFDVIDPATAVDVAKGLVPSGAIQFFARNTAPDGWLKANGANVSRSAYSALFAGIGTVFGNGDGSTTFTLPDMRGEFPRGWDDGRSIDSGRTFGSAQTDAIRNMTGSFNIRGTFGGFDSFIGVFKSSNSNSTFPTTFGGSGGGAAVFDASNQVPTASENRPRNIALLACIKY